MDKYTWLFAGEVEAAQDDVPVPTITTRASDDWRTRQAIMAGVHTRCEKCGAPRQSPAPDSRRLCRTCRQEQDAWIKHIPFRRRYSMSNRRVS